MVYMQIFCMTTCGKVVMAVSRRDLLSGVSVEPLLPLPPPPPPVWEKTVTTIFLRCWPGVWYVHKGVSLACTFVTISFLVSLLFCSLVGSFFFFFIACQILEYTTGSAALRFWCSPLFSVCFKLLVLVTSSFWLVYWLLL